TETGGDANGGTPPALKASSTMSSVNMMKPKLTKLVIDISHICAKSHVQRVGERDSTPPRYPCSSVANQLLRSLICRWKTRSSSWTNLNSQHETPRLLTKSSLRLMRA